ncbi:DnaA N-terminal domain-containing protein [uncultured Paracoccus sp.]|uniref:DnaA N-terminal domain-containing protein n=1 Tax=uncultured Paracoccus sp. TaxID=189685 RepID=UPI002626D3A5|nr:DnaA N-terminal domain-containing protein [uncultured Paracoccus sp.]
MQIIRPVGREASAKKYDLLSALMAHALAGDQHRQRLVLRLMALITTRYNWQRDELTMGQREMARLWCVDERTVKRDMARLKALGWVVVKRQGARGRVSVLGLGLERIMLDTRAEWAHIGPDFVERAGGAAPVPESTVVPFRPRGAVEAGDGTWGAACRQLAGEDPALYEAWFAALSEAGCEGGVLVLIAPTRFHASYVAGHFIGRLLSAASRADPAIRAVRIRSAGEG